MDILEILFQHLKQKAAMIHPDILVNVNCTEGEQAIIQIIISRSSKYLGIIIGDVVECRGYIYYHYPIFVGAVKKVEWADPLMLETIEGWLYDMV